MKNPDIQDLKDIALYELSCIRDSTTELTKLQATASRRLKAWQYENEGQSALGASYELVSKSLRSVKKKIQSTADLSFFKQPIYGIVESFLITKCGFYGLKKNDRLKVRHFTVSSSVEDLSHLQAEDNREWLESQQERFHKLSQIVTLDTITAQILWEVLHDSYDLKITANKLKIEPKTIQTKYDYLIRRLKKAAKEPTLAKHIRNILTLA